MANVETRPDAAKTLPQDEARLDKTAAKKPLKPQSIRASLDMSPAMKNRLDLLGEELACTQAEVLRKGIVLLDVAVKARGKRLKLALVPEDQPVATEIVGIW